jgi:hypothetical protein
MQTPLPTVSSEGGPVLIGDHARILKWRGIEEGGRDYRIACDKVADSALNVIDAQLLVWNFGGPGTGELLFQNTDLIFVRTWADRETNNNDVIRLADNITFRPTDIHFSLSSGIFVILWAPEDGASITSMVGDCGFPVGDFSMGGTAWFQRAENGPYKVYSADGKFDDIEFTAVKLKRIS